jgi:Flp pilus assembly protein TadB
MQNKQRKAVMLAVFALVLALVWLRPLENTANRSVESGLQRALVTYASARALNGVLSVVKSASVSFQVGAGASVQPGAVLDPLDDLVEQFSTVMLVATLSFAMQEVLIHVFSAWPLALVLSALFLAWAVFVQRERRTPQWLARLSVGLLTLSLSVPAASLASELTYHLLMARDYAAAQADVSMTSASAPDAPATADSGTLDKLRQLWSQTQDIGQQVQTLQAKAGNIVSHLITLAAVFLMQTVVLPLLFLWGMLRLYRLLWKSMPNQAVDALCVSTP